MNFLIYCLLAGLSLEIARSSPQICEKFPASFVAVVDETIDAPDAFFLEDPDFTYFKEVMGLRDDAIQHTIEDAIKFFNQTFGLDFSLSSPNENNEYFFENAVMRSFRFADIDYLATVSHWIQTGSTRSACYQILDGGFTVSVSADQRLHGSYGGAEGVLVGGKEYVNYGFYVISSCQQSPVVIQYQSSIPVRQEPTDGTAILRCDLYNSVLGYGRSDGIFTITPEAGDPERFRLYARQAFVFPQN